MTDERDLDGVPRVAAFKTVAALKVHLATLPISMDCDDEVLPPGESPLGKPVTIYGRCVGNRFATHPMEGWDGERDGRPSDLTRRRWRNFGLSGGKLIWGGEAVAVRHDGRANPNQLMIAEATLKDLEALRQLMIRTHVEAFGTSADLYVGLQLTHSGRFAKPNSHFKWEPTTLYRHPILDRRFGVGPDHPMLTDAQIADLVADFVRAAVRAQHLGFDFIDFWAVDWNYRQDTFHNEWQTYRTRKSPVLRVVSDPHPYQQPGNYRILVKVIDIFGNDTTQLLEAKVN